MFQKGLKDEWRIKEKVEERTWRVFCKGNHMCNAALAGMAVG